MRAVSLRASASSVGAGSAAPVLLALLSRALSRAPATVRSSAVRRRLCVPLVRFVLPLLRAPRPRAFFASSVRLRALRALSYFAVACARPRAPPYKQVLTVVLVVVVVPLGYL